MRRMWQNQVDASPWSRLLCECRDGLSIPASAQQGHYQVYAKGSLIFSRRLRASAACAYRSVIAAFECPACSCKSFTCPPDSKPIVINVRRKSCAASFPNPASLAVLPTTFATTSSLVGVSACHFVPRPGAVEENKNWYPSGCEWRNRCRANTVPFVLSRIATTRSLPPFPYRTVTKPASPSTSIQRSITNSERRSPVYQ